MNYSRIPSLITLMMFCLFLQTTTHAQNHQELETQRSKQEFNDALKQELHKNLWQQGLSLQFCQNTPAEIHFCDPKYVTSIKAHSKKRITYKKNGAALVTKALLDVGYGLLEMKYGR